MTHEINSALEHALQQCAAEPIHQLGAIQAHGVALVLSSSSEHSIIQASENLATLLSVSADFALNQSLSEVLGETAANQVELLIVTALQSPTQTAIGVVELTNHIMIKLDAHIIFQRVFLYWSYAMTLAVLSLRI